MERSKIEASEAAVGIGFVLCVDAADARVVVDDLNALGETALMIGTVAADEDVGRGHSAANLIVSAAGSRLA